MPKKDGIEVVIELMSQKPGPGIIVLTHSAKEEDLRRALAAGAKGVETRSAGRAGTHLPSPFGDHTFTGRSSIVWAVTSCPQKQTRVSARHTIESSLRSGKTLQ